MTNSNENILHFSNVNLRYYDTKILNNINLDIKSGEHCVILGPNGSGKSTLIKLISSELYPSLSDKESERLILGKKAWNVAQLRRHLGIVTNDLHNKFADEGGHMEGVEAVMSGFFGTIGLFPHLEVKPEHKERAIATMQKLGIERLAFKKLDTMSTGELRKCLVARALLHPLKAILLDEPTVGLDIKAQLDFIEMMRNLANNGTTVILVTHHIEEIFKEISKVIMIKHGEIIAQGDKADILNAENLTDLFEVDLDLIKRGDRYSIVPK